MTGIQYTVPLAGYASSLTGVSLPIQYGRLSLGATATDQPFVDAITGATLAAVASKIYRVVGLFVKPGSTDTTIVLNSKGAGAGTAITEVWDVEAKGGFSLHWGAGGIVKTKAGENLTATSGAAAMKVHLAYVLEPV